MRCFIGKCCRECFVSCFRGGCWEGVVDWCGCFRGGCWEGGFEECLGGGCWESIEEWIGGWDKLMVDYARERAESCAEGCC